MAKDLEPQDIDVMENEQEYSLSGGDFFKSHPEKILAEPYEGSGRFGPVTKYRPRAGKKPVDVLSDIETPAFIGLGITDMSAGKSVIMPPADAPVTDDEESNIDKAIADSEKNIIKRQRSEKRKIQEFDEPEVKATIPFEDILRNYNKDLSEDEIKAFLWYQHQQGITFRGRWLNFFNPTVLSQEQESAFISKWVKEGILFYYKGELQPAYVYFSENLYDKKEQFEQRDADEIIRIYGQQAYDNHSAKLSEAFSEIYNNRLKLDDPNPEKRLHLRPFGDFTAGIEIRNWNLDNETGEPKQFLIVLNSKGDINWYSAKTSLTRWRDTEREKLSIADAFRWWLKYDNERPEMSHNLNWEDIFKYYLDKKAVKNEDPTVTARKRALSKDVGDKLFSKFLAEIILENDRVMVERLWNERYNSSRGLRTEKIPIAFECALNYPGDEPVEIRPEKREAVAFATVRGSSLNAYQVGVGKANLLTSNILTPKGWVKMGDIKPGMNVISKNGKATQVLEIYPQGKIEAFRVTFSDGSFTEVTGDHLWTVQNIWDRYTGKWRTLTTSIIKENLYNKRGDVIYSIPMVDPVEFDAMDIPLNGYLLGALLGDGGLTKEVTFSNPEKDIQNKIKDIVQEYGLLFNPSKSHPDKDFHITRGKDGTKDNYILNSLRELGLIGLKSTEKFIPDCYLYNTLHVRLEVLQGIMDTDGYVNKNGHCTQICTSSRRLADGITEIVRSFGGTVSENIKHPKYSYAGEIRQGNTAYVLTISLPAGIVPFTSKKHLTRYKEKSKYKPVRYIISVDPIGKHEAQCIRVAADDHLYVCDEYIVTHNTWAAILTMAQFLDAGLCKRPFLVVPNQVYKQFYSEIRGILPHRQVNDLYNLGNDYFSKLLDENGNVMKVEEGSISIMTYEGFEQIGFNEQTQYMLVDHLRDALMQITSVPATGKKAEKQGEREQMKLEGMLGKALQKTRSNIEDLGFDFVCFDEAHALKNIFGGVKGRPVASKKGEEEESDDDKRGKKMYEIQGSTSTRGIKAYCLCSYIQLNNHGRNILLLTATPFTNNPLEVFSMLSLVAYAKIKEMGLANINSFFDNYAYVTFELVINSKLQPVRVQVFKAFDNLLSLQKLVYTYMLHKEAGKPDANGNIIPLIRPDKWVLPYKGRFNDKNEFIPAGENEIVDTVLPLSDEQKEFMEEIVSYVEGNISYEDLQSRGQSRKMAAEGDDSEENLTAMELLLDEGSMDSDEKAGVRTLRGVNFARSLALSPYLYEFSGLGEPDYKNYVEKSPKLHYIMECIRSVKKWHESKNEPVSGQVIYMDRGKAYFELLKDYLVKEIGFKPHEIGIIRSGKEGTAKHKDAVKNGFLGLKFDENTKSFSDISDDERIKVVIGTSSIREGMNLQRYATVLYNAFVDWNPTDQIQLEGRIWRQGNSFKNVRIVLPQMSDSMDIFMFQKLEVKTERINSIWNYDGKSNVLKVEELDPREQKLALVTNPRVIAELEVEDEQTKISEEIADVNSQIETARNIISFYQKRDAFEKNLSMVLSAVYPEKTYQSIDTMIKDFEDLMAKIEESQIKAGRRDNEYSKEIAQKMRSKFNSKYDSPLLNYDFMPFKDYSYGSSKGAVAMLKKAKKSFLDRNGIADNQQAVGWYITEQEQKIKRMEEDKGRLKGDEYLNSRAREIEEERKRKKIKIVGLKERVKEFEKLNYLLGIKRDKGMVQVEEFMQAEIQGCPPITKDGIPDVTLNGIKKLEACLERVPQTKELNTDETGEYTPKRKKLHDVIRGKLRAGLHCRVAQEKPVAIFTGGVPGSGKTTFLRKYAPNLEKEKIFRIDADEIRAMLPEYQGWNSSATHKETQDIYRGLLKDISEGKPCRFDILWDGTMNKAENYLPLIGDLRRLNYEIYMIYVKVPWDVSRKRTIERYVKGFKDGRFGRYVPQSVVDAANKDGGKTFEMLKEKADGYLMVDGMTGEIIEKGGRDLLADRGYFDHVPTEKDKKLKIAKAIALAQKQKIEILKLKSA